jgi:hypothetical protein
VVGGESDVVIYGRVWGTEPSSQVLTQLVPCECG